jgi:hypothetical protein
MHRSKYFIFVQYFSPFWLLLENRIFQLQTEKAHEGEAIPKLVFRPIVGEIVERQNQSF